LSNPFLKKLESNPESLGEDAHFICQERQTFGVADGVGGRAMKGIDSGIFARELMSNYLTALRSLKPKGDVNLKKILLKAHSKTVALGSSTACVVTLKRDRLCYANVGDSGFMVFRGKRLVYRSPTHHSFFNYPFSLGNWVQKGKRRASVFLGEFDVEQGDIVVAGTDGLFDNLFGSEIEEILQEHGGRSCPQDLAWTITTVASMNSTSEDYDSPFAVAAESEGIEHIGGKDDDITIIIAIIELDQC
jgi:protein phosphatase PTC7